MAIMIHIYYSLLHTHVHLLYSNLSQHYLNFLVIANNSYVAISMITNTNTLKCT